MNFRNIYYYLITLYIIKISYLISYNKLYNNLYNLLYKYL